MGTLLAPFPTTRNAARLRHTFQVTDRADEGLRAFNDCRRLTSGGEVDHHVAVLTASMNRAVVEELTQFAVHAGVVQSGDRLVVFPAESGGGKTTLTAACLVAGFDYVSDEALVMSDDGSVVPYPKPLALSRWSCHALGLPEGPTETLMTADDLGASIGSGGVVVSDIVMASYEAAGTGLTAIPRSNGVAALLTYAFNHYKEPARAFRLANEAARRARVWRLEYDDPMEAAELLMREMG